MANFKDMTGYVFNGCEVLEREGSNKDKKATWKCKCYCGNVFVTTGKSIRAKSTISCGCYKNKVLSKQGKKNGTHKETGSKLYYVWHGMKKRCNDKNNKGYKWYGGRGIKICDEWLEDYIAFKNWAVSNGYEEGLTIDRINVDGNYEPDNCRWVDMKTQQRNRRNNVKAYYDGEERTISEIAEMKGESLQLIYYRYKNGVDFDAPKRRVKESDLS